MVDARRGVGNKCIFPAGPLRAPLAAQIAQTDGLLVVGDGTGADDVVTHARARDLPVFHGRLAPDPGGLAALKGRSVLAFAGIGDPQKFFATAVEAGFSVAERRAFADHHRYTAEEAAELIMQAEHSGLVLLTTEKDHARMAGEQLLGALATRAHTLRVTMMVEEGDELRQLLTSKRSANRLFFGWVSVAISLQNCLWRRVSLLQIDIPVLQFLKRDWHTAHRAAHKCTRPHDAEIAIEVFHLRLAPFIGGERS